MTPTPTGTAFCIARPRVRSSRAASEIDRLPAAASAEYSPSEWPATNAASRASEMPASASSTRIVASDTADIKPGNSLRLLSVPLGTFVHNVELKIGRGGQICRSAGCYAQVMAKEGTYVLLRLPSGELRQVLAECRATIGQVGNLEHENEMLGKAGRARWLGYRPANRGTTMNPIDHPHGGGEGRTKGGRHPVTPWGKPTKGYKTRSKKKPSNRFIVKRRA